MRSPIVSESCVAAGRMPATWSISTPKGPSTVEPAAADACLSVRVSRTWTTVAGRVRLATGSSPTRVEWPQQVSPLAPSPSAAPPVPMPCSCPRTTVATAHGLSGCVFRSKPNTDSAPSRTLIPRKPNTDSGASRTPIPPASRTLSGPCSGIARRAVRSGAWRRSPDSPRQDQDEEGAVAYRRLSMRRIREILRLKFEAGLSQRAIARAIGVSNSTVSEAFSRLGEAGPLLAAARGHRRRRA